MWKTVKLSSIATVIAGQSPKGENYNKEGRGTPFYQGKKDYGERYLNEPTVWTDTVTKLAEKNDVLISVRAPIGALNIATQQICIGRGLAAIRPSPEILHDFLFYSLLLISPKLEGSSGAIFNSINKAQLEAIEVLLPTLSEQQRIVAKLDTAFSEIDTAIELVSEKQKHSEKLADAALDGIVNLEGETVTVAQVCSIEAALVSPTDVPYLHQKHIGAGNIISFSNQLVDVMTAEEEKLISGKYPFNIQSVLYSKIRPYLRKVHLPAFTGVCSADIYPLVPASKKLTREFLFYVLLSNHFTNYAIAGSARAGMPKVNRDHLFAYEFTLPSLDSQIIFSEKMEQILSQTQNLKNLYKIQRDELISLKSAILSQELQPMRSDAA